MQRAMLLQYNNFLYQTVSETLTFYLHFFLWYCRLLNNRFYKKKMQPTDADYTSSSTQIYYKRSKDMKKRYKKTRYKAFV
jgi:hypothetical protein